MLFLLLLEFGNSVLYLRWVKGSALVSEHDTSHLGIYTAAFLGMHVVDGVGLPIVFLEEGVDLVYMVLSLVILFRSVGYYKSDRLLVMLRKSTVEEKAEFLLWNLLVGDAGFGRGVEVSVILSKTGWIINTLVDESLQV